MHSPTSVFLGARLFGATIYGFTCWFVFWAAYDIVGKYSPWSFDLANFAFLGLLSFLAYAVGKWFWPFESGWEPALRLTRVVLIAICVGGAALGIINDFVQFH